MCDMVTWPLKFQKFFSAMHLFLPICFGNLKNWPRKSEIPGFRHFEHLQKMRSNFSGICAFESKATQNPSCLKIPHASTSLTPQHSPCRNIPHASISLRTVGAEAQEDFIYMGGLLSSYACLWLGRKLNQRYQCECCRAPAQLIMCLVNLGFLSSYILRDI